jgi:hypothetical protein
MSKRKLPAPIVVSEGKKLRIENNLRDELQFRFGGEIEKTNRFGRTDLTMDDKITEVKDVNLWKAAVGQVIVYSLDKKHRGKKKCIHLFGAVSNKKREYILDACNELGIEVVFQAPVKEEPPDENPKNRWLDLVPAILNAPLVDESDPQCTNDKTTNNVATVERYEIAKTYGERTPSFDFILGKGPPEERKMFNNFVDFCLVETKNEKVIVWKKMLDLAGVKIGEDVSIHQDEPLSEEAIAVVDNPYNLNKWRSLTGKLYDANKEKQKHKKHTFVSYIVNSMKGSLPPIFNSKRPKQETTGKRKRIYPFQWENWEEHLLLLEKRMNFHETKYHLDPWIQNKADFLKNQNDV